MSMQKFTGRILGLPKQLQTANTNRTVVHVRIGFLPDVDINGELPEMKDGLTDVQLSFWDEKFQNAIMADAESLIGETVTGYCDGITKRDRFYNGTGYAFVRTPNAEFCAPLQVITRATGSTAPTAPVAPV